MFGAGDGLGAGRVAVRGEWFPRPIFRGDCGDARREECAPGSPRARILSFGVKPLPLGLASAQALSCRFSFPRHRFVRAGDEESDPHSAWAPQLSFTLLLNLWGVIATPTPPVSCVFLSPCPTRLHRRSQQGVFCARRPLLDRQAASRKVARLRTRTSSFFIRLPHPSPPCYADFLTLPFCAQQWGKGFRFSHNVFQFPASCICVLSEPQTPALALTSM